MSDSTTIPKITSFTTGDIVISVVGDGDFSGTYTDNQAAPLVLEEINPATGAIVGQMTLPQTTTLASGTVENAISGEYGSSSEGTLELAANGQSLVIAGYGVNADTFNAAGAPTYGSAALAQSTSIPGGPYTAVPRVIADISYNGTVDTSTALYNVFNTNNPRSVATVNGSTFYLSGQGVKGDTTQGVFIAQDGASSATAIDTANDTRTLEIYNGQLYVSQDSTQPSGTGTSNIASFGTALPTGTTVPTVLSGISQSITLTAGQANSVNAGAVGTKVDLSPENYFFANATTLYVADGGSPKEGTIGDGGLQKWTFDSTTSTWTLQYTLSAGLNLVDNANVSADTAGSTGLIGLTGVTNSDGTVTLYATNSTIGDLDQTYLYRITDVLSATTPAQQESFTVVETAGADTNIRGVAFAPAAPAAAPTETTIASGTTQSGLTVTSGSSLTVQTGGTVVSATILSGGTAVISGTDTGSYIAEGGHETVLGSASGDVIYGTQLVSAATAVVSNETIFNGGALDMYLKGAVASTTTVNSGGSLNISGNAIAENTVINGGSIVLQSAKSTLGGTVTFTAPGSIVETAIISAGYGNLATIAGFAAGDVIDTTVIGPGATLTSSVVSGNTVETITSGSVSEAFTFSGSYAAGSFALVPDGGTGVELTLSATASGSNTTTISSGSTQSGITVSSGGMLTVLGGGTVVSAAILSGGSAVVYGTDSGSVIAAGGNETVLGTATGDQIYGTQLVSGAAAVVSNETVFNGGALDLFLKGGVANATTVSNGGALNISGNATAIDTVINGGTVVLESPKAVLSGGFTFVGAGTLQVTALANTTSGVPFGDQAPIAGFGAGDVVDVTAISATGASLTSTVSGGNTIETISGTAGSESFIFAGTNAGKSLQLVADDTGGVEIMSVACFAAGTSILTTRGEVCVENLNRGDQVVQYDRSVAPITWIGHRHISIDKHPRPETVRPVLIEADAISDGVPSRDLYVSPDHALYIGGCLIPTKVLINGVTIRQVARRSVEYFHVELTAHTILIADGTPAESYLETGNRADFENGGVPVVLHPDFAQAMREQRGVAPLVECGPVVTAIRARLLVRADIVTTDDPGIVIQHRTDGTVAIVSKTAIPGHVTADPRDLRRLGVKVASLRIGATIIPIDNAGLSVGWHDAECDGRWTDGHAIIPAGLVAGETDIEVVVAATLAYPLTGRNAPYRVGIA